MEVIRTNPAAHRPKLLTALCILSFMGGALKLLSALFKIIFGRINASLDYAGNFQLEAYSNDLKEYPIQLQELLVESVFRVFNTMTVSGILQFVLVLASLYGVYLMWNMQKKGFFFYTTAQLLLLLLPLYSIGLNLFGGLYFTYLAVFTAGFIGAYASQKKTLV
ncbi:MAG: hypothetical protein ACXITV_11510 [Luteibaculaceae bacterium]